MSIVFPQPTVVHLLTLFRQIGSGDIRIPAFQRSFVWSEAQILDLLNSVNEGFPIGSLLLWSVDSETLKIAPNEATTFPDTDLRFPTSYVLDGMQRLSALYGVFHFGETTSRPKFDVRYDLAQCKFLHGADVEENDGGVVPLASLFKPRQLLERQAKISQLANGDELIDRLLMLQAAFQDYMVPVVTIKGTDLHRIVRIFERINSTGTRLDPVDFMRAITWAEDFDLNVHLDRAVGVLSDAGFKLEAETVIKCVGLVLGIPPTSQGLVDMRVQKPDRLSHAFSEVVRILLDISKLLADKLGVHSSSLVPYEGVLLVLFKAVGLDKAVAEVDALLAWYWSVGFNESLRGKPDHYITRALENWRGLIRGEVRGLEPRAKISLSDFSERRLVSGKALSATFASMFAASAAQDLVSGALLDPRVYLNQGYADCFTTIFSIDDLQAHSNARVLSARVFANLILTGGRGGDYGGEALVNAIAQQAGKGEWEVLRSQFISPECVEALTKRDVRSFLEARSRLMFEHAQHLIGG